MSMFVQAQPAPKPKTEAAKQVSLFYAAFLTIMLVAQLFTFDTFIELIVSFSLPISTALIAALPAIIVATELFALPFLLRMRISAAFRWVSMACGWLVALLWTAVTFYLAVSATQVETVGFFGTVIELIPGWWAVFVSLLFASMAAWSSWGLMSEANTKK